MPSRNAQARAMPTALMTSEMILRRVFFEMMRIGIIPAENLKISQEQLEAYQNLHPNPIKPFAIVIRRQVEDFNKKKKIP